MQAVEIKELLLAQFEDATIEVETDGSHCNVLIVSDQFADLNRVKRQQKVYAVLNDRIADGSIHAVNMKTLTHSEWEQR